MAAATEMLFDEYARLDDSPALYSESTYTFLNRAAGERWSQVRALLEDWFSYYHDEHKEQLRNSLTVRDQGQHLGAWWELYIFSLYRCLGYSIDEIHPELDLEGVDTTPDFLVTRDGESMYVECTVVSATDGPVTDNPGIEAAIYDAINEISDPNFLIRLQIKTEGKEQPRKKHIKAGIGNWLKGINPDDVLADITTTGDLDALPQRDFSFHDWVLTCTAIPKSPDKRTEKGRLLGIPPSASVVFVRNAERIRDALSDKGGHYGPRGSLDKPLIIAVLSVNNFAEIRDAADAVFGTTAISIARDGASSAEPTRRRDGYWRGPDSDRGARVSAVLFSHDMQPWSVASHLPIAFINPWADNAITAHPPLSTITATDEGEMVETPTKTTPQDVFGTNI